MVSTPALFDTCILIDYLRGIAAARAECELYSDRAISIVSWMEVMAGATAANEDETRAFLSNFTAVSIEAEVAERAYLIRKASRIKLPDAIIQASAQAMGRVLVTRNTRDFPAGTPGVRIPYTL